MKAIILAAGKGTRMGKYTENLPKGMLNLNGKTLIERQIETLKSAGIVDIAIVTGYQSDKISYKGIKYFYNKNYNTTNMIESLMSAKEFLKDEDILICYSDIIYTKKVVDLCINSKTDIGIVVDNKWKNLWKLRYGKIDYDLESLTVENDNILELGRNITSSENLDYRYVGIIKLSKNGIKTFIDVYNKQKGKNWKQSGHSFKQGYMTDIINEIIIEGTPVNPIIISGNWLEFDTDKDYEILSDALKNNLLDKNLNLKNNIPTD